MRSYIVISLQSNTNIKLTLFNDLKDADSLMKIPFCSISHEQEMIQN